MSKNDDDNTNKSDEKRLTSCSIDKGEEVLSASCSPNLSDFSLDSSSPTTLPTIPPISHTSQVPRRVNSVFKYPGSGMAANSTGFSLFTPSQWKELERQAMIYKYMMASVPIPHQLLFPISITSATLNPSSSSSSYNFPWERMGGLVWVNNNVMGKDAEPWRCRRTDGKKWRCSRDVEPNQKHCERHLRKARPRSRKPVESPSSCELISPHQNHNLLSVSGGIGANTNSSKTMMTCVEEDDSSNHTLDGVLSSKVVSLSCGYTLGGGGSVGSSPFESRLGCKGLSCQPESLSHQQQTTRGIEWMMKDQSSTVINTSNQQWEEMKQFSNSATLFGSPQTLGDNFETYKSHPHPTKQFDCAVQNKSQRTFIDAWSNSFSDKTDLQSTTTTSNSNINSRIDVGESDYIYPNDMYHAQMGLDLFNNSCEDTNTNDDDRENRMKSHHQSLNCFSSSNPGSWALSFTPGGPLAEVLRPPMDPDVSSPLFVSAEAINMASSPSGVIQMKSDSSGTSSSPASICENMKVRSENTPFQWLI